MAYSTNHKQEYRSDPNGYNQGPAYTPSQDISYNDGCCGKKCPGCTKWMK